ncbi:DUF6684 family protein [Haladaptatus halobius]|jgi:hypothetical protein|uniref:DUF6684 family protein n=1 Tax=Haladaptatus halobius TaxID=2884875 RepID=UPI001D0BD326|nr:DUF6684 family protein [Haladaptatus halobius]
MAERVFDRETILDLTVNIVPLGIMAFFLVLFVAARPWTGSFFIDVIGWGLLVIPFVSLALLTYIAAIKIEGPDAT